MNGALALLLLRRRLPPGALSLAAYLFSIAGWSIGYCLQLRAGSLEERLFWSKAQYLGTAGVPFFGLIFMLQHVGLQKWLRPVQVFLLAFIPVATQALVWTNEFHGLIWPRVWLDVSGPFPMMGRTHGAGFWIFYAYCYGLILVSVILLAAILARSQRLYRSQAVALLGGCLVPLVGNILYVFDRSPLPHLDLTVFGFSITGLSMLWGLRRYGLPEAMPLTRRIIFDSMADGVVALDARGTIIDMNPEAVAIFGLREAKLIGYQAVEVFSAHLEFTELCRLKHKASREVPIFRGGIARRYEVKLAPVDERWAGAGRVLVLRDITARKLAEEQLRDAHREMERRVEDRTADLKVSIEGLRDAQTQLTLAAFYDSLTGLPNRRMFLETLSRRLEEWRKNAAVPFAVLYLDIRRFKMYNDGYGHDFGDQLLIEFSRNLRASFHPGDTVARIGGDEFTVLLAEIEGAEGVEHIAQRCLKELGRPIEVLGQQGNLSVSIGGAIGDDFCASAQEVVREADLAMHAAKKQPESRFALFQSGMRSGARSRLELDQDVRQALDRAEFRIQYQPIVSLRSGAVTGLEALIRWQHARHGLLLPAHFLSVAEDAGVLVDIEEWLLGEVCRQSAAWRHAEPRLESIPFVSINLSASHFRHPQRLWSKLDSLLAAFAVDPAFVRIEILESILISNTRAGGGLLEGLHARGLQIDLDDFGTGYSSLSYLARFPVRSVKIDRSFIHEMGTDARALSIVRTIVALARSLNIDVIAEGVETDAQYEQLHSLGCGFAQGYYFSPPVGAAEALTMLPRLKRKSQLAIGMSNRTAG
jgi:diguanylate cyclase (GGDEF)-like protein/PAS domain S-box-containing protein